MGTAIKIWPTVPALHSIPELFISRTPKHDLEAQMCANQHLGGYRRKQSGHENEFGLAD